MKVLSLAPRSGIHDFTRQMWGHALHSSTWREIAPRRVGHLWWRRFYPRFSVMVHCSPYPLVGEKVRYHSNSGPVEKVIVDVKPCHDPDDMFTLTLEAEEPIKRLPRAQP